MSAALLDWPGDIACKGEDPRLFFGEWGEDPDDREIRVAEAQAICASCPAATDCLAFAAATGQEDGIWGGRDFSLQALCRNRIHLMAGDNIMVRDGARCCRACRRETDKRSRRRQEDEVAA